MMNNRNQILAKVRAALSNPLKYNGSIPPKQASSQQQETFNDVNLLEYFYNRFEGTGGKCHIIRSGEGLENLLNEIIVTDREQYVSVAPSALEIVPNLSSILDQIGIQHRSSHPSHAASAALGITGAQLALAYSGSILVSSQSAGELSASLLPPVHVAFVRINNLVWGIDLALAHLKRLEWPRGAVLISGPSRTADIELTLIRGMHGPRNVHVVFIDC